MASRDAHFGGTMGDATARVVAGAQRAYPPCNASA